MDADFPAAHSMDSAWFAVDKDGRVAFFTTGEAGAAPIAAFGGDETDAALHRLAESLPRSEVLYDRQGRTRPGEQAEMFDHLAGSHGSTYPVLMFLKSLDLVADAIAAGNARQVPSVSDVAVVFRTLPAELSQRLHEDGVCLGCYFHFGRDEVGEEARTAAGALGMYEYSHTCENWISGPYGRIAVPANPVHIDQLPPALRNQIKELRLDVNFAETPHIQPVALTDCASWESRWLDLDGKEHTMPGREEDEDMEDYIERLGQEGDEPAGEE